MSLYVVGCTHHDTPIAIRERLAMGAELTREALRRFRARYPDVEVAILSTCNRLEVYFAGGERGLSPFPPDTRGYSPESAAEMGTVPLRSVPTPSAPPDVAGFLAELHGLPREELAAQLTQRQGREAVEHLFLVAASLDSMVLGETQILGQVKDAYELAADGDCLGPVLQAAFQAAVKTARRVAGETTLHQRRLSIPSVAVADFAQRIFERFDDKRALVIGGGQMAEETLRYLRQEKIGEVIVVNRSPERAEELAARWQGRVRTWSELSAALAEADLVVSTTGAREPIVTLADFLAIEARRGPRPLFVLDLAVPRDFDPAIGGRPEVYLYSIDDLREACEANRRQRQKELPAALAIVGQETDLFLAQLHHRASAPVLRRLREGWERPKEEELRRLLNKLPELDARGQEAVREAFDRLINKLLHPPMESLRDEARNGAPSGLLAALARLFQLKD